MVIPRLIFCCVVAGAAAYSVPSVARQQGRNPQAALDQILERMEAAGKSFQSFSADYAMRHFAAVLKDFDDTEKGLFWYKRAKDGSALIRQQVVDPVPRVLTIKGGTAMIYKPSLKEATIYNLGANKDKAEYLALGVGQSPAKLRETFDISYAGDEKIAGIDCAVLQLKPKTAGISGSLSVITLWVNRATGMPVQQKLQEPGGSYALYTFSAEKINPKISDSEFEQKLPKGVDVIK